MTGSERNGSGTAGAAVLPAPGAEPAEMPGAEPAEMLDAPVEGAEAPAPAGGDESPPAPGAPGGGSAETPGAPVGNAEAAAPAGGDEPLPEPVPGEEAAPIPDSLLAGVEALLFSHGEPVARGKLALALDEPPERIEAALAALEARWSAPASGLRLARVAGGVQLTTRAELREVIERLLAPKRDDALSESALDALSVIAYRQPITLPELNELRGVNSQSVVSTLLRRRLVRASGRKPVVGRPLLYGTTPEFLERFGLEGLDDLPELRELADPTAPPARSASGSAGNAEGPGEAGSGPGEAGSDPGAAGSDADAAGSDPDAAGSDTDAIGSPADAAGSDADAAGSPADTAGSTADAAGSDTGSDTDAAPLAEPESAEPA